MKKEPRRPQIRPIMMAAGKSRSEDSVSESLPNLRAPVSFREKVVPVQSELRIPSRNVQMEQEANTRQSMLNVQNVFGFEISYENRAPPIGAPKAADTPVEAPAAIN